MFVHGPEMEIIEKTTIFSFRSIHEIESWKFDDNTTYNMNLCFLCNLFRVALLVESTTVKRKVRGSNPDEVILFFNVFFKNFIEHLFFLK